MAIAGYNCAVKLPGAPVPVTAEATGSADGGTGAVWQITNAARRVLDPASPVAVSVDGGAIMPDDFTVDYLFGKVMLNAAAPGSVVTVSASYLPMLTLAEARDFSVSCARDVLDRTTFGTVARRKMSGLKDCSGSVGHLMTGLEDVDAGAGVVKPFSFFADGTPLILELYLGAKTWRGWVVFDGDEHTSSFDGLVEGSISFQGDAQLASGRREVVSFGVGS